MDQGRKKRGAGPGQGPEIAAESATRAYHWTILSKGMKREGRKKRSTGIYIEEGLGLESPATSLVTENPKERRPLGEAAPDHEKVKQDSGDNTGGI